MTRYLTALLVTVALTGSATAADGKKLILRWYGQSFFHLTTSTGTQVVFDPHAIEQYGRISVKADLILISHYHNDHTQIDVVENTEKVKVIYGLKGSGKKVDWNNLDEKVKDLRIRTVGVYHDNSQGMERGKNAVFLVDVDGIRICFLGDLGHLLTDEQVKAIGEVDVLMIPVGGVYSINGSEAKKVVAQIKPKKYIIPMHYGTKVYDNLLTAEEFLDEEKPERIKRYPTTNEMVIVTDFKPAEPVIVMLNWRKEGAVPK